MTHPTKDWSRLTHAYGAADDIPGLFARLDGGQEDEKVWQDLWAALCHQGTVYEASYAALLILAAIAAGRAPGARDQAVLMAGLIVAEADTEERGRYATEVAELLSVARSCLAAVPAEAPETFVYLTQSMLAFQGVPMWSQNLELMFEEFEAECPRCEALHCILLGEYMAECDTELHPAAPAELRGVGARVHHLAREAGHEKVAEWATHLFGRATCPECGMRFTISECVADQGSS